MDDQPGKARAANSVNTKVLNIPEDRLADGKINYITFTDVPPYPTQPRNRQPYVFWPNLELLSLQVDDGNIVLTLRCREKNLRSERVPGEWIRQRGDEKELWPLRLVLLALT
jgi:hypothetical protein